jgi:hypothetical protein
MSFKSDRFLKPLGLYNLANYIRSSSPNIKGFKFGCSVISSVSLALYLGFRSHNSESDQIASELLSKLSEQRPMKLNTFIDNLPFDLGRLHFLHKLKETNFNRSFKGNSVEAEGEFDFTKEVHIRKQKDGVNGYDIFTPFYYYDELSQNDDFHVKDPSIKTTERKLKGAIAVHRGW